MPEEVPHSGIDDVERIIDLQTGDIRSFLENDEEERGHGKSDDQHERPDDVVRLSDDSHQGFHQLGVTGGQGTVEAVGDRGADSQLGKRQQGEDVEEQPVQPKILDREVVDEHPSGDEVEKISDKEPDRPHRDAFS